jgi:dCMP deaminase
MQKRVLILHIPVIHQGYLSFFARNKEKVKRIYLIPDSLIAKLSSIKPDIAAISAPKMHILLSTLGYSHVSVFDEKMVAQLSKEPLLMINDSLSRRLQERFFPNADVQLDSVFLRWDTDLIHTEDPVSVTESDDPFDHRMIEEAYIEAQKSSDWWRHVGAVLVKEKSIIGRAFNEGMPTDHTPYQRGAVRDFLAHGTNPELVDTIHAEQKLIAQAARNGLSLNGVALYVTHFPCPVCAKLIVHSGIQNCFFTEGWSTLASAPLLESAGVGLKRVSSPKA